MQPEVSGPTFVQVCAAISAGWSAETCDPADLPFSPHNPSSGQCGTSALVLQDLVGGDLVHAEVLFLDGSRQGHHYWNRLPDGTEVDLTTAQFGDDEIVQPGRVVTRPPGPPRRCAEQYGTLGRRVRERLGLPAATPHAG